MRRCLSRFIILSAFITILTCLLILPFAFCEILCQYLSQEGGLVSAKPISTGDYIYHRKIIFQAQTRSKPVSIEISYIYQSIDNDSITVRYTRIEKKKWGQDFLSFRSPVENIFDIPFDKNMQANLTIGEESLGNYVIQEKGNISEGNCESEPAMNVLLSVKKDRRLIAKAQ